MCSRYSEYHCRQDRSRDIFPPSRHLFQTTQRNQRWLSGTSSLFVIALPIRDSSSLPLPPSSCQFLLVFNFFCREKTACRSRLSIQMGSVYRARTDHPLFPQRTIPFPMNNAFFRQESICRISRNVPTYNSFLSLLFLFPFLFPSCDSEYTDLGQWKPHIIFAFLLSSFYRDPSSTRADSSPKRRKQTSNLRKRCNPRAWNWIVLYTVGKHSERSRSLSRIGFLFVVYWFCDDAARLT